ncbi:recombinase family protein [Pseudomonas aeruginosa]|uniref:recombinase family protein n=1 Tax=Pseudomonas aeruginosa TaxID=287 RepID=UPI001A24069B|nr:recombinase family protein [Pseudomonas aeruginosa]MCS7723823.1 recombinase family protein [Pseudomonas aeruginosa]MDI3617252.1 recombinase family protein [Pseudomonas aeruginosa]MDI4017642.1 recombinase family protein [Pseudomonas aeruginosa]MDI4030572.1 recombinase family protein [Pseudomonas aeruginosa]
MQRKTPVYAYIRMSTIEQAKGDSERRQLGQIERFLQENDGELVEPVFLDRLSSFNGKNIKKGAIKDFLERVKNGQIEKGSVLVIESFDRISRQGGYLAHAVILDIIKNGVDIATLSPYKKYSINSENQFIEGIEIQTLLYRAHEESRTKSDRITRQHQARREKAKDKSVVYGSLPFWLIRTKDWIEFKEPEASDVKTCLSLLKTYGMYTATAKINEQRKSSKIFSKETVSHLLNRSAVCGDLQTHRIEYDEHGNKIRVQGEVIHDYYPALISRSEFEELRAEIQNRRTTKSTGRVSGFKNIFRNVMTCGCCFSPMRLAHMKWKNGGKKYLVCTKSETNQCIEKGRLWFDYDDVERVFFNEVNLSILKKSLTQKTKVDDAEIEKLRSNFLKIEKQKSNILNAIEMGTVTKTLVNRLGELEKDSDETQKRIDELKAENALKRSQNEAEIFDYEQLDAALKDEEQRAIINKILRTNQAEISISKGGDGCDFVIEISINDKLETEISYHKQDDFIDRVEHQLPHNQTTDLVVHEDHTDPYAEENDGQVFRMFDSASMPIIEINQHKKTTD